MGIPRFFRTPKPRNFNYVPIYYDKEKEEFEERIRSLEQEHQTNVDKSNYTPSIRRGSMRYYFKTTQQKERKTSNMRLMVILMVLMFIAAYLIFGYKF